MPRRKTQEEAIADFRRVHGNRYGYDDVVYKTSNEEVKIWCFKHNRFFWQKPVLHTQGSGCQKCAREKVGKKLSYTQDDFLNKVKKIDNYENFDFSKTEYKGGSTKVTITCKVDGHGVFEITPAAFLHRPSCPKCGRRIANEKLKLGLDKFILKANKVHGEYDYSDSVYTDYLTPIKIVCNKKGHGAFYKTPNSHLQGVGCPDCMAEARGWFYESWENTAEVSNFYTSFKVYIVRTVDIDGIPFFKIGKTFVKLDARLRPSQFPYEYETIEIISSDNAKEISKLERRLQILCKEFKYMPKKDFGGKHECFSSIAPIIPLLE